MGLPGNYWGLLAAGVVPGLAAGNHLLVEAGGQHFHGFRRGLDYAFIRQPIQADGCGACYSTVEPVES